VNTILESNSLGLTTTKKRYFNIVKLKAVFKNRGRKIRGDIFEIKSKFLKMVI